MMREAIEAWEAEGGGLREITEGAAEPSVVVHEVDRSLQRKG